MDSLLLLNGVHEKDLDLVYLMYTMCYSC